MAPPLVPILFQSTRHESQSAGSLKGQEAQPQGGAPKWPPIAVVPLGGGEGPRGYPCGGGDGVPQPAAGADFFAIFFFFARLYLFSWEFRVLAAMLSRVHALPQPVSAVDRALLHN